MKRVAQRAGGRDLKRPCVSNKVSPSRRTSSRVARAKAKDINHFAGQDIAIRGNKGDVFTDAVVRERNGFWVRTAQAFIDAPIGSGSEFRAGSVHATACFGDEDLPFDPISAASIARYRIQELPEMDHCGTCGDAGMGAMAPLRTTISCRGCHTLIVHGEKFFCDASRHRTEVLCCKCYTDDKKEVAGVREMVQMTNTLSEGEPWVECERCTRWHHHACVHFDPRGGNAKHFICASCAKEKSGAQAHDPAAAALLLPNALPRCAMTDLIEARAQHAVGRYAGKITVRLVHDALESFTPMSGAKGVNMAQLLALTPPVDAKAHKVVPTAQISYRNKCIFVYQHISGADVLLFVFYVHEYGDECEFKANRGRVNLFYVDSAAYLNWPTKKRGGASRVAAKARATVPVGATKDGSSAVAPLPRVSLYHAVLCAYFESAALRGFTAAHIWAQPPKDTKGAVSKEQDYILNMKPAWQRYLDQSSLENWYAKLAKFGLQQRVISRRATVKEFLLRVSAAGSTSVAAPFPTATVTTPANVTRANSESEAGGAEMMMTGAHRAAGLGRSTSASINGDVASDALLPLPSRATTVPPESNTGTPTLGSLEEVSEIVGFGMTQPPPTPQDTPAGSCVGSRCTSPVPGQRRSRTQASQASSLPLPQPKLGMLLKVSAKLGLVVNAQGPQQTPTQLREQETESTLARTLRQVSRLQPMVGLHKPTLAPSAATGATKLEQLVRKVPYFAGDWWGTKLALALKLEATEGSTTRSARSREEAQYNAIAGALCATNMNEQTFVLELRQRAPLRSSSSSSSNSSISSGYRNALRAGCEEGPERKSVVCKDRHALLSMCWRSQYQWDCFTRASHATAMVTNTLHAENAAGEGGALGIVKVVV